METKSKTFFTSDTHWGHKNIIKYSNRPYANVDEMNEALIDNWNSVVQPDDLIYHLGDFAFLEANKLENVLRRLNGRKRLIWGNHDQTLQNNKALQQKYFEWCKDMYEFKEVVDNEVRHFVLCHYAMLVWNKSHRGAFMLHGHSHGSLKYPFPAKIMDVGVDPQGYFPISIEEVTKRLSKIESQVIDHHGDPTKPDNESKGLQPSDQVNKTEARVNMKLRRKILTAKLAAHKETPFAYDSASGITLIEFFRHPSNLTCAVSDEGIRMLWSNLSGETESEFIAYEDSLDAVLPLKISKILGLYKDAA